ASDRQAIVVEAMQLLLVRGEENPVTVAGHELAVAAGVDLPDAIHVDMQEGVRPQMFGNLDHAAPQTGLTRQGDMFRPHAHGLGRLRTGELALDEVQVRRADKTGDENVAWAAIEI